MERCGCDEQSLVTKGGVGLVGVGGGHCKHVHAWTVVRLAPGLDPCGKRLASASVLPWLDVLETCAITWPSRLSSEHATSHRLDVGACGDDETIFRRAEDLGRVASVVFGGVGGGSKNGNKRGTPDFTAFR